MSRRTPDSGADLETARTAPRRRFLAGDVVLHRPSEERWLVAVDERDGTIRPCGWPDSTARAEDCEIVEPAGELKRRLTLENVAASSGRRAELAREDLERDRKEAKRARETKERSNRRNALLRLVAAFLLSTIGAVVALGLWGSL